MAAWIRREAPGGVLSLMAVWAGLVGAAVLGWACLGLAIVWAVGATISGLRTRKRFRVRPLDPEDVKPMPEGGDTYNVRSDYGTAIGKQVNIGAQKRTLQNKNIGTARAAVEKFPATHVSLSAVMGDSEAFAFATELKQMLEQARWSVHGIDQVVMSGPVEGVELRFPGETGSCPALLSLGEQLLRLGIHAAGITGTNETAILIGGNT